MKIASTIARYLLGLIFLLFGLNGFLHFIPAPPPTSPLAIQFFTVMIASHYMVLVFLLQIVCGVLLLSGYYVPLAIAILAPILVNILQFHILMNPEGLPLALITTILWILVFLPIRANFNGLFQPKA